MEQWRQLPFETQSAAHLLTIGSALLAGCTAAESPPPPPALCWYRSSNTALVLGRGQPRAHIDDAMCRAHSVPVYRRNSGGTTVHITTELLMLDVAIPATHHFFVPDITESYRWFGDAWVETLHHIGISSVTVTVADARANKHTLDDKTNLTQRVCFGGISPYEVCINEKTHTTGNQRTQQKIVGLSQVRRRGGLLLQAGIYMRWQPELLVPYLATTPPAHALLLAQLQQRATGVCNEHPTQLSSPESIMHTIITTFHQVLHTMYHIQIYESQWQHHEQQARQHAYEELQP